MQVKIKEFNVEMGVKSAGIEFEVKTPKEGTQLGDCFVTMTGLIWCKGRTSKPHGIKISWEELAEVAASDESVKAAVKAAKQT